jgi:TonB family protein
MPMRCGLKICLLALALSQIAFPIGSFAQQSHSAGTRKMIVELHPVYPPLARKVNLRGTVRLRVTVSPAGYPVGTEPLGGSPVLVKAATEAVSKVKWEPTPVETREIVQVRFDPAEK